jgi:hypothetical protein
MQPAPHKHISCIYHHHHHHHHHLEELVLKTRKIRIRKVANILETSSWSVQSILNNSWNVCQTTNNGALCLHCMWMKFGLKQNDLVPLLPTHQIQWLLSSPYTQHGGKPPDSKRWL